MGILGVLGRLQEHTGGATEGRGGLVAGQDLHGLVNARKLLSAEARALGPVIRAALARVLGLLEEGLVVVELLLRGRLLLLAVRESLGGLTESRLFVRESRLERGQLLALGGHELLVALLLARLVGVRRLQGGRERVVHVLEGSLDHGGGWRVVTERVLRDLRTAERRLFLAEESRGVLHEVGGGLHILWRHHILGALAQSRAHAPRDAEDLGLLQS